METKVLEMNLISAQDLKPPSSFRKLETYAVVWVESSTKLRTRIDRLGGDNPTWNDKFLFKVTEEFLSSETSGVSIEIYAVSYIRDTIIGTVRFLVGNLDASAKIPSFSALHVQRPSGSFRGMLNVGAMIMDGNQLSVFKGVTALDYRDLMGSAKVGRRRKGDLKKSEELSDVGCEYSRWECEDFSDGGDSTTSSSSATSTVLKDWNGVADAGLRTPLRLSSSGGFLFCGLLAQTKPHLPACLSHLNLSPLRSSSKEN